MLREWMHRLWGSFARRRRDQDIEEELRSHLELAGADTSRREARLHFGGVAQAMEAMRDQRGLPWLEDATRDVRHALRSLRRSPAFMHS